MWLLKVHQHNQRKGNKTGLMKCLEQRGVMNKANRDYI